MTAFLFWFLFALALVVAEVLTGTFYLLVLAVATAVGGVLAWLGYDRATQWIGSAVFALLGTVLLQQYKKRFMSGRPKLDNNLDRGNVVEVLAWYQDGTARVHYRGTQWSARVQDVQAARQTQMRIVATEGSQLVLAPLSP